MQAIDFDDFFDGLFMKFKIVCPPQQSMAQLKLLLAVQFGTKTEQCFVLVQKMERILHDLDFVYVNLIKVLRDPDAAKHQNDAMEHLTERFYFVARSMSNAPPQPKEQGAGKPGEEKKKAQPKPVPQPDIADESPV